MKILVCCLLLLGLAGTAHADSELPNSTVIFSSDTGRYYARSVPAWDWGIDGTTKVYRVGAKEDKLLFTLEWYSSRMYLADHGTSLSIVRLGPWHKGRLARERHFALGFYLNGRELKAYSTLDLAGAPDQVSTSASHYTVIQWICGFRYRRSADATTIEDTFELMTRDGRLLVFDPLTGRLRPEEEVGELVDPGVLLKGVHEEGDRQDEAAERP